MSKVNVARVVIVAFVLIAHFFMPRCGHSGDRELLAKSCVCCEAFNQSAPCDCCKTQPGDDAAILVQLDELKTAVCLDQVTGRLLPARCCVAKMDTDHISGHAATSALDFCVRLSRLAL